MLVTRGNESSCFHLIDMKIARSQPSSQHTYGTRRLQPPRSYVEGPCMVLRYLVQTRQEKNDSGKLEAPKKSYATN